MSKLFADITMSLDGFVAGPDPSMEDPLGKGGMQLHEWAINSKAWREAHGMEGGEPGPDDEVIAATVDNVGAGIMGRLMFSGGAGPWEEDGNRNGWWGEDPPFHHPVFVLTHHEREPLEMQGATTFHFVTDGIESALEQARAAAGDQRVQIHGGASPIAQYLEAGVLEELRLHIAPVFLGSGTRLFESPPTRHLERTSVAESPSGTVHITYEVART